ncbi:hypothetical protein [Streptomyces viridochromogenes]|uniref:hypothetical protein n=1 Tax=Streptomyces viridochromogenes TaxID=1938 RepID=UPI001319D338|nr:hypothetical protein [Streptomyces viridochromogenes]
MLERSAPVANPVTSLLDGGVGEEDAELGMKMKKRLILASLLPVAVLVVIVTQLSRMAGGAVAVMVPPLFAIGTAAVLGSIIRRKSGGDE